MNIQDLLPIRKELVERLNAKTNNNFALVGKHRLVWSHSPTCMAELWGNDIGEFDYFLFHLDQQVPTNANSLYLSWLFNDSAWKDVFLTKVVEDTYKLGTIYSTEYPATFVVQGAMLARYVHEFPSTVKYWYNCQQYMEPHVALCFAHYMLGIARAYSDKFRMKPDNTHNSNHQAWKHGEVGLNEIRRILARSPRFTDYTPMRFNRDFKNMKRIWLGEKQSFTATALTWPNAREEDVQNLRAFGNFNIADHFFNIADIEQICDEFLTLNGLTEYRVTR